MRHSSSSLLLQRALLLALLTLGLAGCASRQAAVPGQKAETSQRLGEAATAPLADLNLVQAKIPPALLEARKAPYAPAASCAALQAELGGLNEVLGADLDSPRAAGEPDWFGKAGDAFGDAAVSGLRSAAEGVLPFRGWLRRLSGAERHSREVAASIAAGLARRAYLRGLALGRGCETPASPPAARP